MSTNVSNFLFVVLIYTLIGLTISIRIQTQAKVKQDLLVSDNFVQNSLSIKNIVCTQEEWQEGVSYPAGSTIKHNKRLFEASVATLDEPLCDNEENCSDINGWKYITDCLPQENIVTVISNADANTELCGESRDTKTNEEPTPTDTKTNGEPNPADPKTNTSTKAIVVTNSKSSGSTSGKGGSTSSGSIDDFDLE